jgi:hypothetical protein
MQYQTCPQALSRPLMNQQWSNEEFQSQ